MDPADFSPADLAAAAQFLRQMLAHVDAGSREASFKFFRDHLTELQNEALVAAVPLVFRELTAPDANRSAESVATDFLNLGVDLWEFPLGNHALNLELAIATYQAALQVYTRAEFPEDWAGTQNNIGLAYWNRIRGERAENLERAITAYEAALQVYTREALPERWAMTQNNIGLAYKDRIRGEREKNLEQAITAYEAALEVRTREAFPEKWAMTQGNFVDALIERFEQAGEAEDLNVAIGEVEEASQIALPDTDTYVKIHYALGTALEYRHSCSGQLQDLAQATIAYRRAAATPWLSNKLFYLSKAAGSEYALGVALSQQGQWYESLEHLDTSLGLYREAGSRLGRADALQQMGRTHYLMGNFDKARIYLRDALRLYQAEENLSGEAACRAGLGRLLLRLNFIDDAIAELDQACAQYRTLGDQARLEELQAVYTLAQKVKEKQPL